MASRRWGVGGLVLAMAMLGATGCGDQGAAPPAEKPAESKDKAAPDGFETSWFGYSSKTYESGLAASLDVTKVALKRLAIEIVEEESGFLKATLDGEARDGTSLVVILQELAPTSTRVSVKVGYLLGDRDAAQRIHSEIQGEVDARRSKSPWTGGAGMPGRPAGGGPP